jgi:putative Mg2+ transporter-C (MgtC) family protein
MDVLTTQEMALRLGAALALGALVGLERERKHRPAGFRTMILISLGSAGYVLVGMQSVAMLAGPSMANLPPGVPHPGQAEISRVLQGLIGGIGFLGAGAVIQNKRAVRGITTAAAVWVTAATGAACGMGLYSLAVLLAIASLFTLVVLEMVEDRYFPDPDDGAFDKGSGKKEKNGHGSNSHARRESDRDSDPPDPRDDAGDGADRMRGEG